MDWILATARAEGCQVAKDLSRPFGVRNLAQERTGSATQKEHHLRVGKGASGI
jgi:hypothetical protein